MRARIGQREGRYFDRICRTPAALVTESDLNLLPFNSLRVLHNINTGTATHALGGLIKKRHALDLLRGRLSSIYIFFLKTRINVALFVSYHNSRDHRESKLSYLYIFREFINLYNNKTSNMRKSFHMLTELDLYLVPKHWYLCFLSDQDVKGQFLEK